MKNPDINSICVFASSSDNIEEIYFKEAQNLGELLAKNSYNIIYGGSNLGLMGAVTYSASKNGALVTGVMPEKLHSLGISQGPCQNFIITKGMRERKAKMDELSQGIIALPGGFGTLEELFEMIVQKQLGYNNKPIVLLNTNNYYDNLMKFFDNVLNQNFAPKESDMLYFVAQTSNEAIEYINNYKNQEINYLKDKIKINL